MEEASGGGAGLAWLVWLAWLAQFTYVKHAENNNSPTRKNAPRQRERIK
jgi:hypothetical protein